jgi:hypothetical protein
VKSAKHAAIVALILPTTYASAHDDTWQTWIPEREISSLRLQIDNDLFAVRNLDRDYTGGLAITLSGTDARDGGLSLDPLLTRIDELLESAPAASVRHARQVGLIAFTPNGFMPSCAAGRSRVARTPSPPCIETRTCP